MKVYGPYIRKDGRSHVIIVNDDGSKKTVSYPKYLKQISLGIVLSENETVDHIDRNYLNNTDSNLQILDRSEHGKKDAIRVKYIDVECVWCGVKLKRKPSRLHAKNRSGPFCTKSCSGKYGAELQNKRVEKFEDSKYIPLDDRVYYRI